jgi:trk system potassium uptake protein TrkH
VTATGRNLATRHLVSHRDGAVRSTPATAASVAAVASGLGLLACAAVGGFDGFRGSIGLAWSGVLALAVGVVGLRRYRVARRDGPAAAFATLVGVLLTQAAVSTVAYLASGTFDRLDDAVFESLAGFTTTALTVVGDPQDLPKGVALWRALTQWTGGMTALVAVATVIPALGVARGPSGEEGHAPRNLPLASRQALGILNRLFRLYVVLTAIGIALYAVAGMGPFDAVTYALTTVSSGGFAGHADSIAHFDSAAIEWAAIGGMVLAGVNLAVVFRSARGLLSASVLRSAELRAFLALIVVMSVVVVSTSGADGPLGERVRQGLFSVVSMLSTTGLTVTNWGSWNDGAQVVLILAAGIGAMSGAIGGGFRIARMLAVLAYVRREVVRQIHPAAIRVVKVGRRPIDEVLVDRIIGYQILYLFVGGLGAIGLALGGASILTALTGTVSALSTVGPAMGQLSPAGGALSLAAPARAALMPLMVLGRLELAPVLVGLAAFARRSRRRHGVVR